MTGPNHPPLRLAGPVNSVVPMVVAVTDYGHGPYSAVIQAHCRVAAAIPMLAWIDASHDIALGDIRSGALTLRRLVGDLPPCVLLGVVDPGVGSERRAIAAQTASGHCFVGPDNGLLEPAIRRLGGATKLVDLDRPPATSARSSHTFDGRDLFAPVAGRLAAGVPITELGATVDPASMLRFVVPGPRTQGPVIQTTVLEIDHFGTVVLALDEHVAVLDELPTPGGSVELRTRLGAARRVPIARTFSDVPTRELLLYLDSDGALALARRDGSAAALLHLEPGDTVELLTTGRLEVA
jgi:S-adenosylmethionine hydrolase